MTIAIFGNSQKPKISDEIQHLLDFMQAREVHVLLSSELRQELNLRQYRQFPDSDEPIDFALSIGGDGTFLTTAAMVGEHNIPILGVNFGHLGFLSEVSTHDVDSILEDLVNGNYTIEQRSLLQISCSEGGFLASTDALNEVAVMKYGLSSAIDIDTCVNGEQLTRYIADGLMVATPTGSTAYNMSVGGPIMVPQSRGIILTPIASHSLTVRPLVIPDDWKIDLQVKSRTGSYMVSIDGRSQIMNDTVTLHIEKSPRTIKLVQVCGTNFIKSLKEKLLWGSASGHSDSKDSAQA
ncbi:MAG: NAD kinase [Paludibacteraceae bacterium]|nr:NAD kinase [Paludibacteraceae bacterium]